MHKSTKSGDMISDCCFYLINAYNTGTPFKIVILTIRPHFHILANAAIFHNTGNVY